MDIQKNKNFKTHESDLSSYVDPDGLSSKKLEIGLWILNNKSKFNKALIIFLISFSAVTWAYAIYGFTYYFVKGMREDEHMLAESTRTGIISHTDQIIEDVIYSSPQILESGDGKYDITVQVNNPNKNRVASLSYCFIAAGNEIGCKNDFIYPEENKYLISLSQKSPTKPDYVQFVIKDLKWEKINNKYLPDWNSFKSEHYNFLLENVSYKPGHDSGLSDKINLNTLSFDYTNNSPYNYWSVPLQILFFEDNYLIGVNEYTAQELMSGEKRSISITWAGAFGRVSDVKIIPVIDILDNDNYIKYEGGVGEEK